MKFDPYRSLAWIMREHHGYLKSNAPFSEFRWADFFRKRVLVDKDVLAGKHTLNLPLWWTSTVCSNSVMMVKRSWTRRCSAVCPVFVAPQPRSFQ